MAAVAENECCSPSPCQHIRLEYIYQSLARYVTSSLLCPTSAATDKAHGSKAGVSAEEDLEDDGPQQGRGANKRRKLANGRAKAATAAAASGGDVAQGQQQHQLEEHEHEEMHDQLHELPFGGDIEIERWGRGGLVFFSGMTLRHHV
jgi:hypothetical protein